MGLRFNPVIVKVNGLLPGVVLGGTTSCIKEGSGAAKLRMAASALNLGDFGPDDVLLVDQMVEPIIMGPNGLRKQGTVMLRKVEA